MTDSRYQEYLDSITALNNKVIEEDNSSQDLQRRFKAEYDSLTKSFDDKVKNFQSAARSAASDYLHAISQLKARDLEGIGIKLPNRVHPVKEGSLTVQQALAKQKASESALMNAISWYREAIKNINSSNDELRKALEARRKAMQNRPKPQVVEEVHNQEVPKREKTGFKQYLPYLIAFVLIVISAFVGFIFKKFGIGIFVGLIIAIVYLVVASNFRDS